ncbi:hypothetical protein BJY52DRAFT_1270325 [Lactarius psammicola]|nr:hypothetical protein BJY52DRAFT_1270325 [Lactarius psammicola]
MEPSRVSLPHAPYRSVFEDGMSLPLFGAVLLATGYKLRIPFLSSIHNTSLSTPLPDPEACDTVTNNGRYLHPLFRHIFSLAPTHALRALAFICLPIFVENGISDFPQALLVVHVLDDPAILPPTSARRKPRSTTQHASGTASCSPVEAPRIRTPSPRASRIANVTTAAFCPAACGSPKPAWCEFATRDWVLVSRMAEDRGARRKRGGQVAGHRKGWR